jgi:SOS-response transcriptional repressor LexA
MRSCSPRADYLLKVQGLSMRDAGILTAICSRCTARTKRARARWSARLHDEVTVKRRAAAAPRAAGA